MESHRKWKKENREKNFIITGLKFSRHDESFKLINREVQLIQGQEMRQLFKGAWQFIVKNNQPKKCNQKENRHSRTKNENDSRLGIWNIISQRILTPLLRVLREI